MKMIRAKTDKKDAKTIANKLIKQAFAIVKKGIIYDENYVNLKHYNFFFQKGTKSFLKEKEKIIKKIGFQHNSF